MFNFNQIIRVTKHFTIDMAHALYGYDGPCKNIHGHTYHLEVTVMGSPITELADPKNGMVIDFGQLKKIIQEKIINKFDHALVLNENAPYVTAEILTNEFEKVILVPFQPTCENLLIHFLENIKDQFGGQEKLCRIVLRETPSSFAELHASDQH